MSRGNQCGSVNRKSLTLAGSAAYVHALTTQQLRLVK